MPKIFISHSSKDNAFAEKLAKALRERGAEVWIDLSDIPAGMKWSAAIQQGLNWAELMLLIVTPDSMASDNVADEWEYYHQKKPIIPIWWIPAEKPFQLNRLQHVDFHQRDFDAALAKLSAELARIGFGLTPPTPNLQQRIEELQRAVQALPVAADARVITDLERRARALLADAKNTPHESAAQALFAELARLSNPTSSVAATVRGLIRRARIRIEMAGDVDEAIDILAEALTLNPRDADVIALLEEAGKHNAQARQRVNDLFMQHSVARTPPPKPTS